VTVLVTAAVGDAAQVIYVYDEVGRLKSVSYEDGKQIDYELDAAGNRLSVKTWHAPPPPVISDVTVWNNTGNFAVTWTAPTTTVAITRYELFQSLDGAAFPATPLVNSLVTSYSAVDRAEGRYTFRVRACNTDGCGRYVTWVNPIIVDRTAPTVVPYVYANNILSTSAEISWNASSDNFELATYEYRFAPSPTWIPNALSQIVNVSSLTPQTQYTVEVRARDRAGNNSALNSRAFTTLTLVPNAPANLMSNHVADCAWSASWDTVPGATSYTMRETNGTETAAPTNSRTISCPIGDPEANKPIWVRACNQHGCSSRSYFGNVDLTPPTTPGVLNIQSITHNSANVTWPASTDNVLVTGYFWRLNNNPTWTTAGGPNVNLTGLVPLTLYNMEVMAFDGIGNTSPVRTGSFTTLDDTDFTPPSQPGTVTISNIRPTEATVSWLPATDNVGVTGYRYKATIQQNWIAVTGQTGELGGLSSSTPYTVEVQARDQMGNWSTSRNSSQFTTAIGIPPAPTGLAYNHAANCAWNVSWNASANATYYLVRDTNGAEFSTPNTSGSVSCPLNDPEANKPRYVRACNSSGCSNNAEFGAAIVDQTPPTQPGAISFPSVTATTATATWGVSTDNVGVTSYEYQLGSNSWVNVGLSTTANLTSLTGSTTYTFNVIARDLAGNSSPVRTTTLTTTDVTPPTQPGTVSFTSVTATTATANWGASTDNVGVTGYEYRLRSTDSWTAIPVGTSVPLTGLTGSTLYAFEVRARDQIGNFSTPRGAPLTTQDITAPTQPASASISLITASTARANWATSTDELSFAGYDYRLNSQSWVQLGNVTQLDLTGLSDYTDYTFEVRGRDSSGNTSLGRVASPAPFRTLDGTAPTQPPSASITNNTTGTTATASWGQSTDNVAVTSYEYRLNGAASWTNVGNVLTIGLTGLTDATAYTFEVRARDAIGFTSTPRAAAVFTTPDITSPSMPGAMTITPAVYSVTFNWVASSDNVGIFGYDYKLSTSPNWTNAGSATGGSFSSLSPQTGYTIELRARDAAGNVSGVRSQSFTTLVAPPLPPTNLSYSHVADCAWGTSWSASAGATSYLVRDSNGTETSTTNTTFSVSCPIGNPEANKPRWVKACNAGGCSGQADFAPSGGDGIAPTQPGALSFTNLQPSSVTVHWGQSTDNVAVTGYQYSLDNLPWVTIANVLSVNLSGLQDNRNYPISVRAIDAAGLASVARSSSFTTPLGPDIIAPTIPGTINITSVGATMVQFNWGAASDAVGVTQYDYRVTSSPNWLSVAGGTLNATISTLTASTSYTLEVRARDAAGNTGPARQSSQFTTQAGVPGLPQWPSKNLQADCSWRAEWWQAASGTVTYFEWRQTNGTQLTVPVNASTSYPIQRSASCEQGNPSSNMPQWVRACNTAGCGPQASFP
jgi:chitodextrinase